MLSASPVITVNNMTFPPSHVWANLMQTTNSNCLVSPYSYRATISESVLVLNVCKLRIVRTNSLYFMKYKIGQKGMKRGQDMLYKYKYGFKN